MTAATQIYYNGTIITMDKQDSIVTHLAVKDDTILAAGFEEIMQYKDENTVCIDLKGKTLLPGFYDGHSHLMRAGQQYVYFLDLSAYPLGNLYSLEGTAQKIKEHIKTKAKGEWIIGGGFDETALKEARHFTLQELDAIAPENPLMIRHISGHILLANSLAYQLAGITKDTPDPAGGCYRHDENGNLTSVIEEPYAMEPLFRVGLPMTDEMWQNSVEYASKMYIAKGVTTAQDGNVTQSMWDNFFEAHKKNMLHCRVQLLPRYPLGYMDLDSFENPKSGTQLTDDKYISLGAVKLIQDGSLQAYTGYLSKPYHTMIYDSLPKDTWTGYPIHQREKLFELILKFHKQGWQIAIHGNGDAAIEDIISAYEYAQQTFPRPDPRHIVIHCQTVREDQLDRMQKAKIIPSFFVTHTYFWGDRHKNIFLGKERAERIDPLQSALRRRIPFTLHNDTYVTPIDPLFSVWASVNRKTAKGEILGEDQQIDVYSALKSITIWGAYQFHEEQIKGSLEAGKLADFVILEQNPLAIPKEDIKDIVISSTTIGGKCVYGTLE